MRENLQNGLMALRRKLGPMKALILVELFSALALVLYINGVFSSGPKAEVGGMLLMGLVLFRSAAQNPVWPGLDLAG